MESFYEPGSHEEEHKSENSIMTQKNNIASSEKIERG